MVMSKMMTMNILLLMGDVSLPLIFLILSVILCVYIAKMLNKSKIVGGILGFCIAVALFVVYGPFFRLTGLFVFFEFIALVLLVLWDKPWKKGLKQCPYCSGLIPNEAKKCKHCSEWLEKTDL